jgi:hypothetical protein
MHIFLGGEVLLYFIVGVEVVEILNPMWIQIGLKFIEDLKKEGGFSIFPSQMGQNPVQPRLGPGWLPFPPMRAAHVVAQGGPVAPIECSPAGGPVACHHGPAVCWVRTRITKEIWPINTESNPIGG